MPPNFVNAWTLDHHLVQRKLVGWKVGWHSLSGCFHCATSTYPNGFQMAVYCWRCIKVFCVDAVSMIFISFQQWKAYSLCDCKAISWSDCPFATVCDEFQGIAGLTFTGGKLFDAPACGFWRKILSEMNPSFVLDDILINIKFAWRPIYCCVPWFTNFHYWPYFPQRIEPRVSTSRPIFLIVKQNVWMMTIAQTCYVAWCWWMEWRWANILTSSLQSHFCCTAPLLSGGQCMLSFR